MRLEHDYGVSAVALSPDGRHVATASYDDTICLFETSSGKEVARLQYEGIVRAVALSSDARYMATGRG